jgi:hypothetical protein
MHNGLGRQFTKNVWLLAGLNVEKYCMKLISRSTWLPQKL